MTYVNIFQRFYKSIFDRYFSSYYLDEGFWGALGFLLLNFILVQIPIFIFYIRDKSLFFVEIVIDKHDPIYYYIFFIYYLQVAFFTLMVCVFAASIVSKLYMVFRGSDMTYGDAFKIGCYAMIMPTWVLGLLFAFRLQTLWTLALIPVALLTILRCSDSVY